ncbi:MAG: acyl-CoA thioesterase [Planctomycetota bacterium]|jgi:acyl-CoA thioester hydrolase
MAGGPKPFETQYAVRIDDINYGGHMGNERALVLFQDGRIRFLEALGCAEKDIGEGRGLILVEATIRYRREAFLHDVLVSSITLDDLKSKSFTMRIVVAREGEDGVVLEGETKMVAYDYAAKRTAELPGPFRAAIMPYVRVSEPG